MAAWTPVEGDDMTEEIAVALFTEWKRRYDEDPESFYSDEEWKGFEPPTYGQLCASFFMKLWEEMK